VFAPCPLHNLTSDLEARLLLANQASQWDVRFYNWSDPSAIVNSGAFGLAQNAVANAVLIGSLIAPQIQIAGYHKVHLISHSAGVWMANAIGSYLSANGVSVNTTFLDSFIPSELPFFLKSDVALDSNYTPDKLGQSIRQ
jgi:hypothetical protein